MQNVSFGRVILLYVGEIKEGQCKANITEKKIEARREDHDDHSSFEKLERGQKKKNEGVSKGLSEVDLCVWQVGLIFCGWSAPGCLEKRK